jgi:hypothetical protein
MYINERKKVIGKWIILDNELRSLCPPHNIITLIKNGESWGK